MSKYAIDFDGVLCDRTGIPRSGDFSECTPVKESKEAIWFLKDTGHILYVFTNREKKDWGRIRWWLNKWDFPELEITNIKQPKTTIYLDDRAVRFTNWRDFVKLIE